MTREIYPGWFPIQMAKHYGFPSYVGAGKGQSIAIISLGGKIDNDELKKDFKKLGIPFPDITVKNIGSISSEQDNTDTSETHLDVEVIGSLCPAANITIYRGEPTGLGLASALRKAVKDENSVISISWGSTEYSGANISDMEKALEEAKKKGITVCADTGDGGSSNTRSGLQAIEAIDGKAHLNYPASSPNVLACGGTQLISENGVWTEWVWNNSSHRGGATGGGVSEVFPLPTWQSQVGIMIPSANDPKKTGRVIPDVSGLAAYWGGISGNKSDWLIYEDSKIALEGGTSAVTPLFASLIVLINEQRKKEGKENLGWINERLYKLSSENHLFNDITNGNNKPTTEYPGYEASSGFDACSGWGTPIGCRLAKALIDLP